MQKPRRLTLTEAIRTTQKPLIRFGDLRVVQIFPQLNGHPHFPNGEMAAIFLPHQTNWSEASFPQPETEQYLRDDLYAGGGRIESLAHLSDKELALTYGGWAGIVKSSGVVGDAGDPSEFERAYLEAIGKLPPNHPPEWRNVIRETLLEAHKALAPDAERGRAHRDRQTAKATQKRPVKNESGDTLESVIGRLSRLHAGTGPGEIWTHLKDAIDDWSGDVVTESGEGDSRCYRFLAHDGKPDTIKFSTFRKKLAALRR